MPIPDPIEFKRGQTFSYVFTLPAKFDPGFFADWAVSSQIRKFRNTTPNGLIADINTSWINGPYANTLLLFHQDTEDWPLGPLELDVRFESPSGHVITTKSLPFMIVHEITK